LRIRARHHPHPLLEAGELAPQHRMHRHNAAATPSRVAWPGDQLPDPSGKALRRGRPDFKPKPRRIRRRLISTSCSFDCTKLARGEQRAHLLRGQATCNAPARNQPSRSAAQSRARRCESLFTGIALKASRTFRVQQLDRKTRFPASPHRAIATAAQPPARSAPGKSERTKPPISAAGSLKTLPSRTILPLASTTHTLAYSQ